MDRSYEETGERKKVSRKHFMCVCIVLNAASPYNNKESNEQEKM